MQTLLKTTQAYKILHAETRAERSSHAYLLLMDDKRNLREACKAFAKLFFGCDMEESGGYQSYSLAADKQRISKLIDEESFTDCLFFPEKDKKILVDDAEKICEECILSAVEGNRKVFVLCDFADANAATQNKLLKLLEEPPQEVVFLLGATSAYPLLSTVLSRAKKLEILPFDAKQTADCLARLYGDKFDKKTLELCAVASGGVIGTAQAMLEGDRYTALLDGAFALATCPTNKLPATVKQYGESKSPKELLSFLRILFRDGLLLKTQGAAAKSKLLLQHEYARVSALASKYSVSALLFAQEAISAAEKEVAFNAVFPQCIEICMAKIRRKNEQTQV